jgi:membrane carboxypeptidase/penicillin-binding protein PbpC
MMLDVRTSFVTKEGRPYVPWNYDLHYRGPVRLREALASSYNLVAVKVLDQIGVATMTGLARRLGITTFDDSDRLGLAVTLGGGEVRLLELSAAYAALANGGHLTHPVAILRVEDSAGRVLWSAEPRMGRRVLDERVAYLITDILSDDRARIPTFGEGSVLELSRPAAVKTGTTGNFRDNWTVGYTPDLVVGVWIGNADNEPMYNVSGISGAAPVWHDFMEAVFRGLPITRFERPAGLVQVEVCALSGLLPEPDCPHRVRELFIEGTEPTEVCSMHQRVILDRNTGRPATVATAPEHCVERVYTVLPPEAQEWAWEHGIPQPPPVLEEQADDGGQPVGQLPPGEEPGLLMTGPDFGAGYRLDPTLPRDSQRVVVSARPGSGMSFRWVILVVDGRPLAQIGSPPYKTLWVLEPGEHVFWAEGVGLDGERVRSDEVRISVRE